MSENQAVAEPVKAVESVESVKAPEVVEAADAAPTESTTTSSSPKDIIKQVEFYFSDQNLPTDQFLYKLSQKSDGWVPVSTICVFSRMKRFRPVSDVVDALRQSQQLEVSENGELVRRKNPLVEPKKEERENAFARSIYAKGFGDEVATSQFDIEKFFESFGDVKQVRLRRDNQKKFKSSVFVEFATLEEAEKFLALDPKPKFHETELLTMSKRAYVEMKAAEHGFTANANGKRKFNAFKDGRDNKRKKGDNKRYDNNNNKRRGPNDRNREREAKEGKEEKKEDKEELKEEKKDEKKEEKEEPKAESKEEPKEKLEEPKESKGEPNAESTEVTTN